MGEQPQKPGPPREPKAAPARPTSGELREQQAIAAAMMIGEQMRREDRKQIHWLTKRLGFFTTAMSVFGLLILFAYSRMREDYHPTVSMLIIGAIGAVGAVAVYWAYTEERRE